MPTIVVEVMPKPEVLDPQGKAIDARLPGLGSTSFHPCAKESVLNSLLTGGNRGGSGSCQTTCRSTAGQPIDRYLPG